MKLKPISFLAILISINACKEAEKTELTLNGVWNSIGYGQQIIITDSTATIYDTFAGGCSYNTQYPKDFSEDFFEVKRLTADSLTLHLGYTNYHFVRPSNAHTCEGNTASTDALVNFDALWNTFNENYPSFELRGIDWEEKRQEYRTKLNSQSTDLELFTVLEEMTSDLNDGHVSIDIPEVLEHEFNEDEYDTEALRTSVIQTINSTYVDSLNTYNHGTINWGTINTNIGYIQINDFMNLANYDIDKNLDADLFWENYWNKVEESENFPQDVLNGMKEILSKIFTDIKNTKSCVIDIRFNGGGFDKTGLEVLGYFVDKKTVAFTKKARFEDGFTESQSIYIEPNGLKYDGNLYILTSFQTASASETFVLASQNLMNVTTIGSNTEGILSDILSKRLPNGWEYGLSNEIYESTEGINYEKGGIPPNYNLSYSRDSKTFYNNLLTALKKEDGAIEKVIEMEAEKSASNKINKSK